MTQNCINETHMLNKTIHFNSFISRNETELKMYKLIWDILLTLRWAG